MEQKKIYAKTRNVRMSPRKARLVIDIIRGKEALYASEMLKFINKSAALPIRKTLESAIANAIENEDMEKGGLKVVEARIDEAQTYKRGRAVSKGRYHKILKRNSHIIIAVSDGKSEEETKDKKKKKTKAGKVEIKKKLVSKGKKDGKTKKGVSLTKQTTEKVFGQKDMQRQSQQRTTQKQRKVQAKG